MTSPLTNRDGLRFALFAAASLVVIGAGCWTASQVGVVAGVWGRMIAAWVIGLAGAILLARANPTGNAATPRRSAIGVAGIIVLLLLGLADAGLQGVHRWIVIGPVRLNVAMLLLPLALVLLASLSFRMQVAAATVIMALLIAQPDASQATAFGMGAALLLCSSGRGWPSAIALAVTAILAATAWLRPDPLAAVPEVEGIVALAWNQSPMLAITAIAALALAVLAPLAPVAKSGGTNPDPVTRALSAYMAATAIMPAIGVFPVPLMGMSISPIIGFWVGIGMLARRRGRQ